MDPLVIVLIFLGVTLFASVMVKASSGFSLPTKKKPELSEGYSCKSKPRLSPPGERLLKEYNELPADARPVADILPTLEEFDRLTDVDADERYHHFRDTSYYTHAGYAFTWQKIDSWDDPCEHEDCKFSQYYKLHEEIRAVKQAVAEKEEALKEKEKELSRAQYAHGKDLMEDLATRLREEAEIQRQTTKELA